LQEQSYKYWAFISYSHRDQAWAEWLHRALETYRVPRRLAGRGSAGGTLPHRLYPVFRDQEELPSSPNLSSAIDRALQQSRTLIVIASPHAAVSKWVDQEIARFRALGRGDRILCLIVDGEPHAGLQPGSGLLECFPPSLRTADGVEPVGADLRPGKDGKPLARLKLIAGLLGVGLDELRRREQRRRRLRNLGLAALSLAAFLALGGLWLLQQREKREALAQQALRTHIDTVYEKGRQELIAHNQARAAVYLNEAYRLGVDTPALRLMLARAMRIVDAQRLAFQTGSPVVAVRFSPDSRLLVTTGADNVGRVWDASSAQKRFEFAVPGSGSSTLPRFSRDSRLVFVSQVADGAAHGLLQVWNVADGKQLASLQTAPDRAHAFNPFDRDARHVARVTPERAAEIVDLASGAVVRKIPGHYSVAGFSRDGLRFFTGGEDGLVTVWDGSGQRRLRTLRGLSSPVFGLDDSEDGKLLAASARNGAVHVWRAADGQVQMAGGHPSPNPGLIFNVDGTRLLTKASDGVRLWDTGSGQLVYVQQFAGAAGNRFDISSNGRWMMSASSSRLAVEDVQSGFELFTLDGHSGLPEARDISEDDRSLATGGPDGRLVLWNMPAIPDFELRHPVDPLRWATETKPPAATAAFSHSGKLVATGAGDGLLRLWDAQTGRLLRSIEADPRAVDALAFSPDDARLLSGGYADGIKIWDASSGALLRRLDCGGKRVLTIAINRDGSVLAAAILGGVTRLWDSTSGEVLASFERDEARSGMFGPDGRTFLIGSGQEVRLWGVERKSYMWSVALKTPKAWVSAVDFSRDGKTAVVAQYGQDAVLLDAADGRSLSELHDDSAGRFASARLGPLAAFGDQNGSTVLWHPGGAYEVLTGHAGGVLATEFSPDGAFLLTAGADASAKLWDTRRGELLDTVAEHPGSMPEVPYQAAGFSPDGRWLLTGSTDGTFRLWRLDQEARSPAQVAEVLKCHVPWRLEQESLLPAAPDAACARPGVQALN